MMTFKISKKIPENVEPEIQKAEIQFLEKIIEKLIEIMKITGMKITDFDVTGRNVN